MENSFLPIFDELGNPIDCSDTDCPPAIGLSNELTDGVHTAAGDILTNGTIIDGTDVTLKAEQVISLEPGFTVEPGATFEATIEDCSQN